MCLTPINLKKETFVQKLRDTYHMQQVPCGRCMECMRSRVDSWHVRLSNQLKYASSALFVTLTYDDENLNYTDNGSMTLNYRDHQLFMKRLRKEHLNEKLKYFCVGEYGNKTNRPHFHSILFNARSEIVTETWKHGNVHIGQVTDASIRYTLKYALKRATKWKKSNEDDRMPEKALMSRGLGLDYLTPEMINYHKDELTRHSTVNGTVVPLPRYYRDKIFTDSEKLARNKMLQDINPERFEKISSKFFPQRVKKIIEDQERKMEKTD